MSRVARSSSCHESSTDSAMLQRAACTASARINRCIPCRIQMVPERCPFPSRKVSCESWVAIDKNQIVFNYIWGGNLCSSGLSANQRLLVCNITLLFVFLFLFPGRCLDLQSYLCYRRIKRYDDWFYSWKRAWSWRESHGRFSFPAMSRIADGKGRIGGHGRSVLAIGEKRLLTDQSNVPLLGRVIEEEGPRILFSLSLSFAYWTCN